MQYLMWAATGIRKIAWGSGKIVSGRGQSYMGNRIVGWVSQQKYVVSLSEVVNLYLVFALVGARYVGDPGTRG